MIKDLIKEKEEDDDEPFVFDDVELDRAGEVDKIWISSIGIVVAIDVAEEVDNNWISSIDIVDEIYEAEEVDKRWECSADIVYLNCCL